MYLIDEELENKTIFITADEITEKELEVLIEDNTNFIFKQVTYFKQQTKKGLIRLSIFAVISMIIALISIVQFKNYSDLSNISFLLYITNLGMLISLNLSLEEISTAYKKYRISAVKISTFIGLGLGLILGVFFGYLAYLTESERPQEDQQFFTAISIFVITNFLLCIGIVQIGGLIGSSITRPSKKSMSIVNILASLILIILFYLFILYFIFKLTEIILLLLPIFLILIQIGIFSLNAYIFNKYGKAEIIITPLRIIWVSANKVNYYRFKEITKIEFGNTKAILTLVSGIIDVKDLNLESLEEANKTQIVKLDRIAQDYLTKTHEGMKSEKLDANG